ncbi:hypothetical protein [Paracidovorax cattleyae]|uniref:Uncharacterized protein n=1 Tax=Paracidovorax cattleyae TaxID=80868 RepID=A0A1H0KAC7_9BURK|nr:hypothetical protein [Paracidovorax cattleyae]AVS73563.1 hypothetical protein C8240_05405 [Paracidovorax cattleyae]MBF9265260.1 hypothetical protein [Paracidovorax cattleyae]SDO52856.1 hypothetical protein SAMN04489708_101152 [Paracidovorax cattleyae]
MARQDKNAWAAKVVTLIRGGQTQAAMAQIKVAPSAGDVARLQTLLAGVPSDTPVRRQLDAFIEEERALLAAPRLHRAP